MINFVSIVPPEVEGAANMLKIQLDGKRKMLFLPKLARVNFTFISGFLYVSLIDDDIKEIFEGWITDLSERLNQQSSIDEVIIVFNRSMKQFLKLFAKNKEIGREKISGLYGELLELESQLDGELSDVDVLNGWHRPSPALHDFDYNSESVEIKTTGRTTGRIKITNEHQLTAINMKSLKIRIIILELVESSKDSLGELYLKIYNRLKDDCKQDFASKCYTDTKFAYLGPEEMPTNYKISVIESSYYNVDQDKFPRISADNVGEKTRQGIMNGISNVKYSIDISSIEEFKCN